VQCVFRGGILPSVSHRERAAYTSSNSSAKGNKQYCN
jgi:hypothetical protein